MKYDSFRIDRRWLLALFLLAFVLRLAYLGVVAHGPLGNGDSFAYEDLAQKLLHHQPYTSTANAGPGGFPTDLQRPPGYPAFLALVAAGLGPGRMQTALVQSLLGALFAVAVAVLVARCSTALTGLLAGLFYAVDWASIVYAPMAVSETLFAVLLGTAICLFALFMMRQSGSVALAAGLFLGAAALVKPIAELLVLAFLFGCALLKKPKAAGLLFLVSYLACTVPWMARNYRQHGLASLSAIGTVDLYFYVGESAAHSHALSDVAGSGLNDEVTRLSAHWAAQPLSPSERRSAMRKQSFILIKEHWPTVVYQSALGLVRTSLGPGSVTVGDSIPHPLGRPTRVMLVIVPSVEILALWLLALVGALEGGEPGMTRPVRLLLVACVLLIVLPASSSLGQSRFRVPAVPPLAVLAASGSEKLLRYRIPDSVRRRWMSVSAQQTQCYYGLSECCSTAGAALRAL